MHPVTMNVRILEYIEHLTFNRAATPDSSHRMREHPSDEYQTSRSDTPRGSVMTDLLGFKELPREIL